VRSKIPNHGSEKRFAYLTKDDGKKYVYQPCWFIFSNGMKYLPDFYCMQDDIYIEVVGCPTIFKKQVHKYLLMEKEYPQIELRYVWVWNEQVENYRLGIHKPVYMSYKKRYGMGIAEMAKKLGISNRQVYNRINDKSMKSQILKELAAK